MELPNIQRGSWWRYVGPDARLHGRPHCVEEVSLHSVTAWTHPADNGLTNTWRGSARKFAENFAPIEGDPASAPK